MRKTAIALLALGLVMASTAYASHAVRISQIYGGGGGGATNTYRYDYVELFNSSSSAVDISGWMLQYGSATGSTFGSSTYNVATLPAGASVPACGYYLVQVGSAGNTGCPVLPTTPDFVNNVPNVSATTGKFALTDATVGMNQTCATVLAAAGTQDVVGWATANCFEGTVGPTTDGGHILVRNMGGMTDTDNNLADFTNTLASGVVIHNSTSGTNPDCTIVPTKSTTWGRIKTIYK